MAWRVMSDRHGVEADPTAGPGRSAIMVMVVVTVMMVVEQPGVGWRRERDDGADEADGEDR